MLLANGDSLRIIDRSVNTMNVNGPPAEKMAKFAISGVPDQPAHPRSLILSYDARYIPVVAK